MKTQHKNPDNQCIANWKTLHESEYFKNHPHYTDWKLDAGCVDGGYVNVEVGRYVGLFKTDDVLDIGGGQDNLPDLTWCYQWPITENFDVKALFAQTSEFNNIWSQAGIVIKSDDHNYAALWFIGEGTDPAYSRIVIDGTVHNRIQMQRDS